MGYENYSDEMLINAFKDGDEAAFEALLKRYDRMVKGLARTVGFLVGDVEDLWQEGFLGLFIAAKKFDGGNEKSASFKTFAYSCIKNKMLSAVTAENKDKNQQSVSIDEVIDYIYNDAATPEEIFIDEESKKEVTEKIKSKLSDFEIKVFDLLVQGYKYTEIADILRTTAKSVDNALSRIREKCKIGRRE